MIRYRRYAGDGRDFHLGPYITFTSAEKYHRPWGFRIDSGGGDYPGCHLVSRDEQHYQRHARCTR